MAQMTPLAILPGAGLDGYRWKVLPLPQGFPWHIDMLIAPSGIVVGWTRTKRINSVTEALAMPETYAGGDKISLLYDGLFLGVGGTRIAAAETVSRYIKHTRL